MGAEETAIARCLAQDADACHTEVATDYYSGGLLAFRTATATTVKLMTRLPAVT